MKLKLKSNPDNPRTISKDAYQRLKKKIEKNPKGLEIHRIAHRDGIIIAGNQRWRVINDLKLELKPEWFYDLNGWSDQEVTDWLIDSNISDGEWDVDMLYNQYEPEYLLEHGIDLPYDTSSQEIEEDEAPEADEKETPKSKLGEVYQLGRHRVMCGDSTDKANVELLMNGDKADMVFTDPPYGVDYEGVNNDDLKAEKLREFITSALSLMYQNSREGANAYVWHPDIHAYEFIGAFRDSGFTQARPSIIQWLKDSLVMSQGDYHSRNEPCLYGWKPGGKRQRVTDRKQDTIWEYPKPKKADGHPTMKPIELCARAIKNSSSKGEIIIDTFLGSGSTLIACEQTDRTCYGMELDEKYLDVIRKRWAKYVYPDRWEKEWEILTPAIEKL